MRILLLIILASVSGCAANNMQVQKNTLINMTPSGCSYSQIENKFSCIDKDQERYLSENKLTDQEMENLGKVYGRDADLLALTFMKLHDCVARPQGEEFICTYEWTADAVAAMNATESVRDGKFVYAVPHP